jgi:hypothetical protein
MEIPLMKKLIITAAVSALALPVAAADARPGHGHGHGNAAVDQYTPQPPQTHQPRRCKRTQSVGFVVKGALASYTADTVTLDVKRANRHARSYIESAGSEFALGTARLRFRGVTDGNGDGAVDLADVQPTDKVIAIGKAVRPKRGCEGQTVLKLRKLQVVRPKADETEAPEQS